MRMWFDIKNHLFGYTFLGPVAEGESYSTNILLKRNLDNSLWVGKVSQSLPHVIPDAFGPGKDYIRTVDFRDVDDRAVLGFRLAKLAGLKTLKNIILSGGVIQGFDLQTVAHPKVNENIFLSEKMGVSLPEYLVTKSCSKVSESNIKNKDEIVKSFVLNLWIGNYDSKDADFLVDDDNNLISIDYHLSGPGFTSNPKLSVGAWGESFDIENSDDIGWCAGGEKILEYIKEDPEFLDQCELTIQKITSISSLRIKLAMRGLRFYNQGTSQLINAQYLKFLLERRPKLQNAIRQWKGAGYPLARLPKNNGVV